MEAWLKADSRHYGAYIRAQAALVAMEEAVSAARSAQLSDNDNEDVSQAPSPWWRRIAAVSAAGAMAASLAWIALPPATDHGKGSFSAAVEVATLTDGTVARLKTGSRMTYAMADDVRKVTLLHGKATFDVAKDKARPFVVRVGDVYAQATGTVYSVETAGRNGGHIEVTEGSVPVWAGDEREQAVLLEAGGSLTLQPGPPRRAGTKPAVPPPPPERAQISFDDVPLSSAVARLNRINETQIVISDPAIGEKKIVGLFQAHDPEHFARAAAELVGAEVVNSDETIVIKMK
jgi:transmembrane sensor